MLKGRSIMPQHPPADEISLSSEHRQAVLQGGVIDTAKIRIAVTGELLRLEIKSESPLDVASVVYPCRVFEEVLRLHGRLYIVAIAPPGMEPPLPECRRWVATWDKKFGASAIAVVNSESSVTKLVISLLIRAINLVRKKPLALAFFATENEARAWIEPLRRAAD
jgi:uncharacterized heparinase superfamily protein